MKRILLITKACCRETERQVQLQASGYEVLCSETILKQILGGQDLTGFFDFFQIILLSEELSDPEVREAVRVIKEAGTVCHPIYRFVKEEPLPEECPPDITACLAANSATALQQLPPAHLQTGTVACFSKKTPTGPGSVSVSFFDIRWFLQRLQESLTATEARLLEQIFAKCGRPLLLQDCLCGPAAEAVSGEETADLSGLIFSLRKKIAAAGYPGPSILLAEKSCFLAPAFYQWFDAAKQAL